MIEKFFELYEESWLMQLIVCIVCGVIGGIVAGLIGFVLSR